MAINRVREKELVDDLLRAYGERADELASGAKEAASRTNFSRADHRDTWATLTEAHVAYQTGVVLAAVALRDFWDSTDPAPDLVHDLPAAAPLVRATDSRDLAGVRSRLAELRSTALAVIARFRAAADEAEAERILSVMHATMGKLHEACDEIVKAVGVLFDYNDDRYRRAMLDGFVEAARATGMGARVTETVVMPDGERVVVRDEQVGGD